LLLHIAQWSVKLCLFGNENKISVLFCWKLR